MLRILLYLQLLQLLGIKNVVWTSFVLIHVSVSCCQCIASTRRKQFSYKSPVILACENLGLSSWHAKPQNVRIISEHHRSNNIQTYLYFCLSSIRYISWMAYRISCAIRSIRDQFCHSSETKWRDNTYISRLHPQASPCRAV